MAVVVASMVEVGVGFLVRVTILVGLGVFVTVRVMVLVGLDVLAIVTAAESCWVGVLEGCLVSVGSVVPVGSKGVG
jgi:hypothetical protein